MEKFNLAKKYHGLEKNVWVEFVKIALEYQPLNLGQGLPDDLVPNYVIDSLSQVLKDPNASLQQYTRGFGHPRLINAIGNVQPFVNLTFSFCTLGGASKLFVYKQSSLRSRFAKILLL